MGKAINSSGSNFILCAGLPWLVVIVFIDARFLSSELHLRL